MDIVDLLLEFNEIQLESVLIWSEIEKSAILSEASILLEDGGFEDKKKNLMLSAREKSVAIAKFFKQVYDKVKDWFSRLSENLGEKINKMKGSINGKTTEDLPTMVQGVTKALSSLKAGNYEDAANICDEVKQKALANKGKKEISVGAFIGKSRTIFGVLGSLKDLLLKNINEGYSKAKQAISSSNEEQTRSNISESIEAKSKYMRVHKSVSKIVSLIVDIIMSIAKGVKGVIKTKEEKDKDINKGLSALEKK